MKHFIILLISTFLFLGCSSKNYTITKSEKNEIETKIDLLAKEVETLSKRVDKEEAYSVAFNAVTYSLYLAKEYKVVEPALFHNLLVNLEIKERGLCYHYANDLLIYLKSKKYKSFDFIKIISNQDTYFEHTSIAITTNHTSFKNSIVLDPWRDCGRLYFSKIKNDNKYKWEKKE